MNTTPAPQERPLQDTHAVVTGGGRGIGAAIALRLIASGARVTLFGRSLANLQQQMRKLAVLGQVQSFTADVADKGSVNEAFSRARSTFGEVSILVNNAGQTESAPFLKTDEALWQRMLAVNLTGTFQCTYAALPDMLHRGHGRIVNIASTAGLTGYPYVAAYCAAKHGVVGFTRALAEETRDVGIAVNAVCPGSVDTDMLVGSGFEPRMTPDDVAGVALWLAAEAPAALTGTCIDVFG